MSSTSWPQSESSAQANPHVVATDAIVVSVSEKQKLRPRTNDRVVLVALPAASANAVAGAALVADGDPHAALRAGLINSKLSHGQPDWASVFLGVKLV